MNDKLQQLAAHLARLGLTPTYRGDPYGQGLDWLYFDCFFHEAAVRRHFGLGAETRYVAYDGRAGSGLLRPAHRLRPHGAPPRLRPGQRQTRNYRRRKLAAKAAPLGHPPKRPKIQRVTLGGQPYLAAAARAAALPQRVMLSPANQWPLPGQVDPHLLPCAFCRRRLRIGGKPVFTSCSCKAFGPPVTVVALAAGALVLLGGAWWLGRRKDGRKPA